jgi:hypothetical protein
LHDERDFINAIGKALLNLDSFSGKVLDIQAIFVGSIVVVIFINLYVLAKYFCSENFLEKIRKKFSCGIKIEKEKLSL